MIYRKINLNTYFNKSESKGGLLTVYAHENTPEINPLRKYPSMLIVHGGGYQGQSFRESEPVSLEFFNRGFNCFELYYDLSPFCYKYSPLIEGAMAMKYIRGNLKEYNCSDKVCACGFSAGGHLVSFLGTSYDDEIYKDFFDGDISGIRPDAIICSYSVISEDYISLSQSLKRVADYEEETIHRFSTEKRVTKNSSPAFIWTTADDKSVNCLNSIVFAEKYAELNIPFSLHIFPCGQHGLSLATDIVDSKNKSIKKSENLKNWLEEACLFLSEQNITIED